MRYFQVKQRKKEVKNPLITLEDSGLTYPNRIFFSKLTRKEKRAGKFFWIFQGGPDSDSSVVALGFICLSKGLLKASAWIVPACCWLCLQMIKSLHWISCLGSFIVAAVNPNTGKVTALCLSSQILSMCSGLWSAEMARLTPYCRCSWMVEELIAVVRVLGWGFMNKQYVGWGHPL